MDNKKKMHHLFVQHLQTMYDGEQATGNAFFIMSKMALSPGLQNFYGLEAAKKTAITERLRRIFDLLNEDYLGEKDRITRSYIRNMDPIHYDEYNAAQNASVILGRAMNVYWSNAYRTAVSCALELGQPEIADMLCQCFNERTADNKSEDTLNRLLEQISVSVGMIAA